MGGTISGSVLPLEILLSGEPLEAEVLRPRSSWVKNPSLVFTEDLSLGEGVLIIGVHIVTGSDE